jgi:hypothetical protein
MIAAIPIISGRCKVEESNDRIFAGRIQRLTHRPIQDE